MPRPATKNQLLEAIEVERKALEEFLAQFSPAQMSQPSLVGEWSAKDVLAHLTAWEQMVLGWYAAGLKGKAQQLLRKDSIGHSYQRSTSRSMRSIVIGH